MSEVVMRRRALNALHLVFLGLSPGAFLSEFPPSSGLRMRVARHDQDLFHREGQSQAKNLALL